MFSCLMKLEATIVFYLQTANEKRFRIVNNYFIVSEQYQFLIINVIKSHFKMNRTKFSKKIFKSKLLSSALRTVVVKFLYSPTRFV